MPQIDPKLVFGLFIIVAGAWTVIWLWIMFRVKLATTYSEIAPKAAKIRKQLFYTTIIVLSVVFVISMYWLPYPVARTMTVGEPEIHVQVTASQWSWSINQTTIPKGKVVEFVLIATDVNHGFGLYDPDGSLLTQAQVIPGYEVSLIWKFDRAGTYTIWCLEFCGVNHHSMKTTITVE